MTHCELGGLWLRPGDVFVYRWSLVTLSSDVSPLESNEVIYSEVWISFPEDGDSIESNRNKLSSSRWAELKRSWARNKKEIRMVRVWLQGKERRREGEKERRREGEKERRSSRRTHQPWSWIQMCALPSSCSSSRRLNTPCSPAPWSTSSLSSTRALRSSGSWTVPTRPWWLTTTGASPRWDPPPTGRHLRDPPPPQEDTSETPPPHRKTPQRHQVYISSHHVPTCTHSKCEWTYLSRHWFIL